MTAQTAQSTKPKIAIVHEYFNQFGGAERVVCTLANHFPNAPIYTLFSTAAMREKLPPTITRRLIPSFLQHLPEALINSRIFFPLYPIAIEQFDLSAYDIVISSSSAYANGIITRPHTKHICYCHSPTRYLWDWTHHYLAEQRIPPPISFLMPFLLSRLRLWDYAVSSRVDHWIANSQHVQQRIAKYYRTPSTIIYPPTPVNTLIDTSNHIHTSEKDRNIQPFFLLVSRLSAYKRVEIAISACNASNIPLTIVGTGREEKNLRRLAGPQTQFLGRISDKYLWKLYTTTTALIFPGEEDFGLVMVEALACGTPVIAYAGGGASEIITPGHNGELFPNPTTDALIDAITRFQNHTFTRSKLQESVLHFDEATFLQEIEKLITASCLPKHGVMSTQR